jgi:uncharacterized iron-regulated membrane protein
VKENFRRSMVWLHSWGGLLFGWVIFVILVTGTLSLFEPAITDWMQAPESAFWHHLLGGNGDNLGLPRDSEGGRFFIRFHSTFYLEGIGRWAIGIATLALLVALTTGVIIHTRIFRDFFTFRRDKGQRSWLDAHTAFAVMALPFLFMIAYSGLMVVYTIYMPAGIVARYQGDGDLYRRELFARPRGEAFQAAPAKPHPPIYEAPRRLRQSAAVTTQGTIVALHFAAFGGPFMKWLYFVEGLMGSAAVGIGLALFGVKHKSGARWELVARRLTCGVVAGFPLAILFYFTINRLLPAKLDGRYDVELDGLLFFWGLSFIHACLRAPRRAWAEQTTLAALLAASLPILNAVTSDISLAATLPRGEWTFASIDLVSLGFAAFFGMLAWRLWRQVPEPLAAAARASRANV